MRRTREEGLGRRGDRAEVDSNRVVFPIDPQTMRSVYQKI